MKKTKYELPIVEIISIDNNADIVTVSSGEGELPWTGEGFPEE